ncbi:uncharacterized protein SOCE836_066370 [Sorangium cellulosum]|uniref:Uncharacterized protein n=1 Tax=Sorangium cellulosum TaxID=56 RepID=A0A4P2QY31_SORCE|nr:uncharacterized protein SOCE836_066370 [Sorangium cellulosum]WCQ93778.1 hypothetical protein NQZ70_06534 [Sorangium sp. Soce836]
MRNALAPRPPLPAILGLAAPAAPPARGPSAEPRGGGPAQRPAAPIRDEARGAGRRDLPGRRGRMPHRAAQVTTVCAPGGGHE